MKTGKNPRAGTAELMKYLVALAFFLTGAATADVGYDLNKADTDPLYPAPGTNGYPGDTREIIRAYLEQSLKRDRVSYTSVQVDTARDSSGRDVYRIRIDSPDPMAAHYAKIHPRWLGNAVAGRALSGIRECKDIGSDCWNPLQGVPDSKWEFFLPLGLPMVSQRAIMLLHYPPYVSLQEHDYLENETLWRWERLLRSAGVAEGEESLYETIVDIIPIAAPGSGQSAYLPTLMATYFFDYAKKDRAYVSAMLKLLADPPTNSSKRNTRPVVVFGREATSYWLAKYHDVLALGKHPQLKVLDVGSVKLDRASDKSTPFMIANHPIAAVYYKCDTQPRIVEMVSQDLTTACFARKLGDDPDAKPELVKEDCAPRTLPRGAELICINAYQDMTPPKERTNLCGSGKSAQKCLWDRAVAWCRANDNQVCPAPGKTQ